MNKQDEFVAVDFETANSYRGSACEIGLVRFANGQPVSTYQSLVLPHHLCREVSTVNEGIHGISNSDLANAPEISEIWEEIWSFVGDSPLIAHNASFDMGVFFDVAGLYGLDIPFTNTYCSLVLSRVVLKRETYRLSAIADSLAIPIGDAHRGLDDALVAARITSHLLDLAKARSLEQLARMFSVAPGILETNRNVGCKKISEFSDHETSLNRTQLPTTRVASAPVEPMTPLGADSLLSWINQLPAGLLRSPGAMHGEEVLFVGELERCPVRQAQKLIALEGGLSSSRLTKFTSLIVTNTPNLIEPSSKIGMRGLPVISESELFSRLKRDPSEVVDLPIFPNQTGAGVYYLRI